MFQICILDKQNVAVIDAIHYLITTISQPNNYLKVTARIRCRA